ncbi:GNAT family N-acetyltransferase [Bradyrhizobium sp. 83012]|uniref:GNAT family N-acetyltransferase n=1 Tax=Bradyrhizobium aeschynomenes TaxID=2734909 RepID=A0ABX2CNZ6_9BRAD|nr:GNAT family protein [Bradyrhizobium aeschynomenes]NPU69385.1 GNAT family N-acetyltransferase [Bradyrhizobium aeschynomenes]
MTLDVREMELAETALVIDYFYSSSIEQLDLMGIDPTRMPTRPVWAGLFKTLYELPLPERAALLVVWRLDGRPIGFSSCDRIVFGSRAHMHLHVTEPELRGRGLGTECVRRSIDLYFERLRLKQLFCEPHAYNIAPNRALQKAGFRYLKTYKTVPGPMNYHQAVTRWMIER